LFLTQLQWLAMNKHIGSDFDELLDEQNLNEEVCATALSRVIAWRMTQAMSEPEVAIRLVPEPTGASTEN
jgi:hypothetical protein